MQTLILILVLSIPILGLGYSYYGKKKKEKSQVRYNYKPINYDGLSPIELEFVRLVNEHRINIGLGILIPEKLACEVCKIRVLKDIADNVSGSHYAWEKLISDSNALEGSHILGNNNATPKGLFNAYMSSQGHREALENPDRTHIGTSFIERRNHTILTKYD